ncbi:MAG: AMP-binding protein, partial [Novosphingobium sp.]
MHIDDFDASPNLVALFLSRADELGDKPFLTAKRDGVWQSITWAEAAREVCLVSESLLKMGLKKGDRVVLVSENRPEWCLADLAIMAAEMVSVPAYITNTGRDHTHILENAGAAAVIVSDAKLAKPLLPAVMGADKVRHLITFENFKLPQLGSADAHLWASLLAGDAVAARAAVDARVANIKRSDLACVIYTSGTGGAPRGVMQHHGM